MMGYYTLARYCRYAALIIVRWPILMLIAFFVFPYGPHVLIGVEPYGSRCIYLGSRGITYTYRFGTRCPFLLLMPAAKGRP